MSRGRGVGICLGCLRVGSIGEEGGSRFRIFLGGKIG